MKDQIRKFSKKIISLMLALSIAFGSILPVVANFAEADDTIEEMNPIVMDLNDDQPLQASAQPTVIAEGRFENQPIVAGGLLGAPWRLYSDGMLVVDEGFINWAPPQVMLWFESPWHTHRTSINQIVFTGSIKAGPSLRGLFSQLENVTKIEGLSYFDTSDVTDMRFVFHNAISLEFLDLSNWETSNVTNMNAMFWNASNLESLDLSNFNTSNVTNMQAMFSVTRSLENLDLSNWDTSSVVDMAVMFEGTNSLKTLDISHFITSSVTNMSFMFARSNSLTYLDLSNFDTSNVTNMHSMFWSARNLERLDLSNWDTSNVTDMTGMLLGTISLRDLALGENFEFIGHVNLPEISITAEFTGYWQNIGSGTVNNPTGAFVFTSQQLVEQFTGATMADTFVWQPVDNLLSTPRDTLRELIEEAEARIQDNYTPRSWGNMQSMLTFARSVYNNPTAIDEQINDAIDLLRARLDELVLR